MCLAVKPSGLRTIISPQNCVDRTGTAPHKFWSCRILKGKGFWPRSYNDFSTSFFKATTSTPRSQLHIKITAVSLPIFRTKCVELDFSATRYIKGSGKQRCCCYLRTTSSHKCQPEFSERCDRSTCNAFLRVPRVLYAACSQFLELHYH